MVLDHVGAEVAFKDKCSSEISLVLCWWWL